jgi:hypothetical protein
MENYFMDKSFSNATTSPPAFAGVLVDWSIGPKEITATIIDLIVRDFIGVSGDKIFITGRTTNARNFEKEFISKLFGKNQSLQFIEVQKTAYADLSKDLIKIICKGLIDEDLISKDFQEKLANAVKESMKETLGFMPQIPSDAKTVELPSWALKPLMSIIGAKPMIDSIDNKAKEKLGGSYEEALLTDAGKTARKEAIVLKEFMEKYPMAEDRLANELVGHAIVFGIGKNWLKRIGGLNAKIGKLYELLESREDTFMKFIDMDSYMKEFMQN